MSGQNSTAFAAALKEVWSENVIEEQIYQGNPLLDAIEKLKPSVEVGNKAVVAIHTGRAGGYSAVPRTGSTSLNAAGHQEINKAEYNYTHHWYQIEPDTAVVDESANSSLAVAEAVNVEMTGAVNDLRKQLTRQAFMNGDALIAQCTTTTSSKEVKLLSTDYGNDAIERGWLYPEELIDIGTKTEQAVVKGSLEITGVVESATEPIIKVAEAVTTTSSHYVSIAGNRSGETSYEMNGLRNLISESGEPGKVNPSTVPSWKSSVDSTSQALSLNSLYERQRKVFQKTGNEPDWALTSAKQYEALYKLLQAQVRFNGDGGLGAGDLSGLRVGQTLVQRQPDCTSRHFYFLTKGDLFVVRNEGPVWASEKYTGLNKPIQYQPGTTKLKGGLVYRMQLALKRRNSHAALTELS